MPSKGCRGASAAAGQPPRCPPHSHARWCKRPAPKRESLLCSSRAPLSPLFKTAASMRSSSCGPCAGSACQGRARSPPKYRDPESTIPQAIYGARPARAAVAAALPPSPLLAATRRCPPPCPGRFSRTSALQEKTYGWIQVGWVAGAGLKGCMAKDASARAKPGEHAGGPSDARAVCESRAQKPSTAATGARLTCERERSTHACTARHCDRPQRLVQPGCALL